MASDFTSETCFTCCKKPVNVHKILDSDGNSKPNICHIICQHFWFKEDDLQSAIVCETCWEKVDQFHLFYLDVKKLHEHRKVAPLSMFIKQEEITIEESQLQENCNDMLSENQKPFVIADCKLEIKEECDDLLKKEESAEVHLHPRKKRKCTSRLSNKKIVKRKNPRSHKPLTPGAKQAEDDFIKQHTRFFCDECNIEFENFRTTKYHRIKTHSKNTVVCCGTQHRTRAKLYQHVQSFLNPEAFKCEICNKTFKFKYGYVRHKKLNHAAEEELVFKCHRCPKRFVKEWLMKKHLAEHETLENETAKCEFCGKCFRSKIFLNNHVKAVHKEPTDFICEVCSKGFYRRSMFVAHRKTHELKHELTVKQPRNITPNQCSVCYKWFKNQSYCLNHMQRHQVEGEHKCEMCVHVSINMMALKTHMSRMHGPNIKPYVCELCGKEYTRATILKEHVANAHTGEHPYQCQYCEKKFFSSATMYAHRKKKHPQEWLEVHMSKYTRREESSVGDLTVS